MPIRRSSFLATLLLAAAAWAPAQSLADWSPGTAVAVLELAPDAGAPADLLDALAGLGWTEGMETLSRLAAVLGGEAGDFADMDGGDIAAQLEEACGPDAFDVEGLSADDLLREGLLSVVATPFAPVPHVLALARPGDATRAGELQDALVACFGDVQLEQDGVAMHVLFDGSDLPVVVARVGDVFVAATEPNLVRGVIRRSLGADEPSLADAPLGDALARLSPGGAGFGLDLGGIAGVVTGLAGALPPDAAPIVERAVAMLEAVGVVAGRAGWDDTGLRFEQVQISPSPAPDPALAALLSDPRTSERPLWLPAGAVSMSSTIVPLRAIVDYLDGWLAELEEPLGFRADVRGLAADFLDLDLDVALLGWIGETVHVIDLAPFGTDLRGWVQGTPRIVAIPVLNEGLARTGLGDLGGSMLRLLEMLGEAGSDPFGDPFADPFATEPDQGFGALLGDGAVVVTREVVDGLEVDRVRAGPTLDMAVTILDGHLVLATPYRALDTLLATRAGGPTVDQDPAWRSALAGLPDDARDVQIVDVPAYLRSLADLADLAAQPLASALAVAGTEGLLSGLGDDGFDDDFGGFDDFGAFDDEALTMPSFSGELYGDVEDAVAAPLPIGGEVLGEFVEGEFLHRYELVGVEPGSTIEIEMNDLGGDLDTYLYVFDGDTYEALFENDDAPGWDRSFIAFVAEPDINYHVLATSWGQQSTGRYALGVRTRGEAAAAEAEPESEAVVPDATPEDAVEPPTFAELLAVTDLLPRTLNLLAERSGLAVGTTTVEGNVVTKRMHWPLR